MPLGKQGRHAPAPKKDNHIGKKPGGGVIKGGGTHDGKTPSPKPGNSVKFKTSR